jgi:hypothetical protein
MRLAVNVGGSVLGSPSSLAEVAEEVRRAERDGFAAAWSVHFSRGYDALTALAVAGATTERIDLGSASCPSTRGTRWRWPSRPAPRRHSAGAGSPSGWASRTAP